MSQDIIADALNMIRNAKKAKKETIKISKISDLLIEILKIMKQKGAIKKYKIDAKDRSLEVTIGDLAECKAIKPRFSVNKGQVEKYVEAASHKTDLQRMEDTKDKTGVFTGVYAINPFTK